MLTTLLIAASLPAAPPAPDELLPETPAGWRYERLDLPLSFAPDLPYAGFEELRFAPGMFEAGSDTFWSYALALRTTTPVDFDAACIEELLVAYYGGLCAAVAESRGIDFERDSLVVALEDHGDAYHATIDMLDAFVTGKPLRLRLELSVHPSATTSELFGIASPADEDGAVWKELRAIRARWRAARAPAVLLNHLYYVPDAETYAALRAAPFLKEGFAAREERTTVRPDMTYSGLYFYGRDTYFEFLEPGSSQGFEAGASGVALGLEVPGATARTRARLAQAGIESFDGPRSRRLADEDVPWFRMLGLQQAHARSRLQVFALEYDPAFLARWHPELAPHHAGIARRQVLARYAAQLAQQAVHSGGLALNVTEVLLALDDAERARFLAACRAFGYALEEGAGAWTCTGPGVTFVVRSSDGPGGLSGFRVALRRAVEPETLRLGRVRVELRERTATFHLSH
jgi:hypothetical protein